MLRYIYANDLYKFPLLQDSMFRDRADQFKKRLGWPVNVDANGWERDEYDALNPLYVIWENSEKSHGGSMRFLPTTGDTMVNDHFLHLTDGVRIHSPLIWECTRFCLASDADRRVTAALVLGAGEVMKSFCLEHFVGVFDPRMERIYRLLAVEPVVIGRHDEGAQEIGVGLWALNEDARPRVQGRAKVDEVTSRRWFKESFMQMIQPEFGVSLSSSHRLRSTP